MNERKRQKKNRSLIHKQNIALELAKTRQLNKNLIGQLILVSNDPESERSKAIIEHYRNILTQMKNDTINPDTNTAEQTAAVPNSESTSGSTDTEQPIDRAGGDNPVTE